MEYEKKSFLLIADKTGEIGVISSARIAEIPAENVLLQAEKKDQQIEGAGVAYEEQSYYKTMYGHGEACIDLLRTADGMHLVSADTLNKVMVVRWPNVFDIRSQMLEHARGVRRVAICGDKVASISEAQGT